jgi:multidrug efflux pump subunit AcrA (membrane-fusion protein)
MRIGKWTWSLLATAVVLTAAGGALRRYHPQLRVLAAKYSHEWTAEKPGHAHEADEPGHEHEADDHDHPAPGNPAASDHKHEDAAAVKLSQNAQANVGLRLAKLELRPFERTITVPGMVIERPGRSEIQVAAPLTGVVTRIWPLQGQTVAPGEPLFDLRLTHEEVVEAQAEYLRTAEELDVLKREIQRLAKVAADGAIPGKTLLERNYEQQKLDGVFRAQRQRLLLHGLSAAQVDQIASKRELLSVFTVDAPTQTDDSPASAAHCEMQVEELKVTKGQHVKAGEPLAVLADHCRLYVQGKAFEQDIPALQKASASNWLLTAVLEANDAQRQSVPGLPIVYLANKVEPDSRAFLFYAELQNEMLPPRQTPDGRRFAAWRFKPGQRVDLLVPVERWSDRIVLPLAALVQDGPEAYVFEMNQGHFDRRAVRVEYRDPYSAVIANDGTLTPGKMVVVSGAYQVHLALKNKSSGAPDPHAGHNH